VVYNRNFPSIRRKQGKTGEKEMEIERKFKVSVLPENLEQYKKKEIEQGYLCTGPVVRIRKSNDDYILTYKSKKGIANSEVAIQSHEVEVPLTKESYEHLKKKTDDHIISKTRYIIPLENGLKAELDMFHEQLEGLVFVEVEFPDEEAAKNFNIPSWFGEDVSFDKRYHNSSLSKMDAPF